MNSKNNILDFLRFALWHVDSKVVPDPADGAEYHLVAECDDCGREPWHYLRGTSGEHTTRALLEDRWRDHYSHEMTRDAYDTATMHMGARGRAVDGIGLLRTYMIDVDMAPIGSTAAALELCSEVAPVDGAGRAYRVGEVLFCGISIAFVCGFDSAGPILVEARNIFHGVTLTRLWCRPWTHRGFLTGLFDYSEVAK